MEVGGPGDGRTRASLTAFDAGGSEAVGMRDDSEQHRLHCIALHPGSHGHKKIASFSASEPRPRRVEYMTRVSVSSSGPPSFERFPCLDAGGLLLVGADRTVELEQQFGYGAADRPPRPWRPAGVDGSGVRVCFRPRPRRKFILNRCVKERHRWPGGGWEGGAGGWLAGGELSPVAPTPQRRLDGRFGGGGGGGGLAWLGSLS